MHRIPLTPHLLAGLALAVLLAALVLPLGDAPEALAQNDQDRSISMDFDGVDLKVFIKFISELTGRNFVIDEKARGRVTVFSPTRITVEEAYQVFLSVLEVYGYIAVEVGEVTKIVPARDGRSKSLETRTGTDRVRAVDKMITQVVPLRYVDSSEVRKMLAPMVSKEGLLTDYRPSDFLIITDFQSNIQRLLSILRAIDVADSNVELTIFRLEYAGADSMAAKIARLIESGGSAKAQAGAGEPGARIVPDERTNVLAVLAGPEATERIREFVHELDQPTPKGTGNIQVYPLEHADAENLATVLTGLAGQAVSAGEGEAQQKMVAISSGTKVVADKSTNSLVITASADDFPVIEGIIESLDVARRQVLVEALIMEVSSEVNVQYGVDLLGGFNASYKGTEGLVGGFTNPGASGSSILNPGTAAGSAIGVAAFPVVIGNTVFTNLQAIARAAKSESEFNIISTPQLMTLDNEEAQIIVAENRPFLTSVDVGQNVDDRTNQKFTYKDVGTTLKVTPQISEGGMVKLKIFQEFSEVDEVATTQTSSLQPVTRKRTTDTTVLVEDGQTVVLSGLIGKTSTESLNKTPWISDIPILGWLFKYRSESQRKTNLLVFISPRIVGNPEEASAIYFSKIRELERIQYDVDERILPLRMPVQATGPGLGW